MSFPVARIGDLGRVVTGRTPAARNPEHFGVSYPFITPTDIQEDVRYIRTERSLSEAGRGALERVALPRNTVCVVCIGATIGKVCMTDEPSFTNQQINSIIVDDSRHDPRYIYAVMRLLKRELRTRAAGAATPIINKTSFENIEVPVPDLTIQRRIGSILGAYDDLIGLNQRRISLLDQIGARIYLEMFDSVKSSDNESLLDIASVAYGRNLPTKHLSDDAPYPVYGASKVIGRHTEYLVSERTLIVGCRGTVGGIQITRPFAFVSNNSFIVQPQVASDFYWLHRALLARGFRDIIGGAAQPQITLEGMAAVQLQYPSSGLRQQFAAAVASMYEMSWNLLDVDAVLATARDLLLPRLVSGELSIAAVERELKVAA